MAAASLVFVSASVLGHQTGTARVDLDVGERVKAHVSVSGHDIAIAIGLAVSLDEPVPRSLLENNMQQIRRYLTRHLRISTGGRPCKAEELQYGFPRNREYLDLAMSYLCSAPGTPLQVDYNMFFSLDRDHIAVGRIRTPSGEDQDLYFDRDIRTTETTW